MVPGKNIWDTLSFSSVPDQCNSFIYKMNEIDRIYKEDMKMNPFIVLPYIKTCLLFFTVVFTKAITRRGDRLSKSYDSSKYPEN